MNTTQKTEKTTSSKQVPNANSGCKGIMLALLLLSFFLPCTIFVWIVGYVGEAVVCTLITVICIGVLFAYYNKDRKKDATTELKALEEKHKQQEAERIAALPNYFDIKIQEDFFNEVKKSIAPFPAFMQIAKGTDAQRRARNMILSDIKTALTEMKTSCDWNKKEGLALYMATNALNSNEELEYGMLKSLNDETLQPAEELINSSYDIFHKDKDNGKLVFADLLQSYDRDIQRRYLIVLYRFLSIAAKADEVVTKQETAYLKNLIARAKAIEESIALRNELDSLVGLAPVKNEIQTLTNFIKIQQKRAEQGLKTSPMSYHCVFTGSPGTGKTTVARIVAGIYKELGILKKGHLIETDRAGLVAEYIGQTAVQTNSIIDKALDGVLFIDEAYSLANGGENDYGKEAIATLLKRMEDNRDRLAVILAGYTDEMKRFIDSNPGLQSRFSRYIEFPDYTADELLQIFEVNMRKYDYHFGEGAKEVLQQYLEKTVANKDANFGNGRFVRNIFEKTLEHQANRLAPESNLTTQRLSEITTADLAFI